MSFPLFELGEELLFRQPVCPAADLKQSLLSNPCISLGVVVTEFFCVFVAKLFGASVLFLAVPDVVVSKVCLNFGPAKVLSATLAAINSLCRLCGDSDPTPATYNVDAVGAVPFSDCHPASSSP